MRNVVMIGMLALAVSGCSRWGGKEEILFDGQRFRGSAKAIERGDKLTFVAKARPVTASLEGAAQAAAYEGTKHCIRYFGTSDIEWITGPDSIETAPQLDGDELLLQGRCVDVER